MSTGNQSGRRQSAPINRSQIANIVFSNAASMGISDRRLVEKLTTQVIERLEKSQSEPIPTLPGMEDMVDKRARRQQRLPTEAEIEAMVMEVLNEAKPQQAETEPAQKEEVRADMETNTEVKTVKETSTGIDLTDTALHVLERRYLKKDKQGNVIEKPEGMFRRVAKAIAAAELNYNPRADVTAVEDEFYQLMANLEFLPNSPTLMNAARNSASYPPASSSPLTTPWSRFSMPSSTPPSSTRAAAAPAFPFPASARKMTWSAPPAASPAAPFPLCGRSTP